MKRPKRFPTQIIENNNILFSPKEHPEKVSISGLNLLPFPSDIEVVVVESGVILGELQLIGFFKSNGRTYSATINNRY